MDRVGSAHLLEHYRRLRPVGRRPSEQLNHRDAFLVLSCRIAGAVASGGGAARRASAEGLRAGGSDAGRGTPVLCCSRFKRRAGCAGGPALARCLPRGAAGLAGVDLGVGDEPCPIDDEAGRDRQRPTLASRSRSGRSMPLFRWMSRRSSGIPQRAPNSWAVRPPRSARIGRPSFNCAWAFAFSVVVCCEMLTRDAPRASATPRGPTG